MTFFAKYIVIVNTYKLNNLIFLKINIMSIDNMISEKISNTTSTSVVPFLITNRRSSVINSVNINPSSPNNFSVSYMTADLRTTGGTPYKNYTIEIYDGLNSPVGREPSQIFTGIEASSDKTIELKSKSNMLSGQYIIGFSVGNNAEKTLCSYVKLISGRIGARENEDVSVDLISAGASGFIFQISSSVLPGIDPVANGDTVIIFDNNNGNRQIGYGKPSLNPVTRVYNTEIIVSSLEEGNEYSVGYYCGNVLGACAAKEYITINNIV